MIVADTNVWARAYLNDDGIQARRARKALAEARADGGVFVPLIVLAELTWVLRARWERERVLATIEKMLQTSGVVIRTPALVHEAIAGTRSGQGGFADHPIAQVGFAHSARK